MLAGEHSCLDIISRAGLEFETLGRSRVRDSNEDVLARICMVDEIGAILKRADIYVVVFDIDSDRSAFRVVCAIKVNGRQIRARTGNSRALLARLWGAASGCKDQRE